MGRLFLVTMAVAATAALAACTEQQQETPSSPEFAPKPPPPPTACDFTLLSSTLNTYLAQPLQQQAQDTLTAMQGTTAGSSDRENYGFSILRIISIASNTNAAQGTAHDGTNAVNATLRCTYVLPNTAKVPVFPLDVDNALSASSGGGFFVRGGAHDTEDFVVAGDAGGSISGISPPGGSGTWASYLGQRVLLYGEPILATTGGYLGYDWAQQIPADKNTAGLIVALCFQSTRDPVTITDASMVFESGVGALAFNGQLAANVCAGTVDQALRRQGEGSFGLMQRVANFAARMLAPELLHATTALTTSIIGGSKGGASQFTKKDVTSSDLIITIPVQPTPPGTTVKRGVPFPVEVDVQTLLNPPYVAGACVTLDGQQNNGTFNFFVNVGSPPPGCGDAQHAGAITNNFGRAVFPGGVIPTKTGNVTLVAHVQVLGRSASGLKLGNQFYVKP
jgi:hypothetical protein